MTNKKVEASRKAKQERRTKAGKEHTNKERLSALAVTIDIIRTLQSAGVVRQNKRLIDQLERVRKTLGELT